jgi:acyl carrier protein
MAPRDDIQSIFLRCLKTVAPEVDLACLQPQLPLRDQFTFDSVNLLDLAQGLEQALGIRIPEEDYTRLTTLRSAVAYLQARTADSPGR